jgi:nucleoside-diphosphate-sugar epimerase
MRVLIAGGGGYIGSAVVPDLLCAGHTVDVVDLLWFGNHLPAGVRVTTRDLFELEVDDLQAYEQVVFMAGLSNDPMADFSPRDNFVMNAAAPAYLAYVAKRAGVRRFVYASSCSVYGSGDGHLASENSPAVSQYAYGIAKLQGELSVMQLADRGYSVICLRQGTVSGYSRRMRLDLVVNTMFSNAVHGGVITVNNPAIHRPILGILDAVLAYRLAIGAPEEVSGVFNVATRNYTVGEIANCVRDRLRERAGIEVRIQAHDRPDCRNYRVSTSKAEQVLGFHPSQDVAQIVDQLYEHRTEFADAENEIYYNIRRFQALKTRADASVPEGAKLT